MAILDRAAKLFGTNKPSTLERFARMLNATPIRFTPGQRSWRMVNESALRPNAHHTITDRYGPIQAPRIDHISDEPLDHDPHNPDEHDNCVHCQAAQCPECGEVYGSNEPVVESNGNRACTGCTTQCDDCNDYGDPDDMTEVGGIRGRRNTTQNVCSSCLDSSGYFRCADCNDHFADAYSGGNDNNDDPVCQRCGEDYFTCDHCDNRFDNDNYGGDGMCDDCYSDANAPDEPDEDDHEGNVKRVDEIHSYGHKPKPIFHGEGRHYGVENEVVMKDGNWEDLESKAQKTLSVLNRGLPKENFAYLKADSSLDEGTGSFEIVTHPATLEVQKERWGEYLKKPPSKLISGDTGCCGLHIHVEKEGLGGDLTIGKMLAFVNAQSNRGFIEAIARRNPSGWANLDPTKTVASVKKPQAGRYEAINLKNDKTVEFRIFKGTLNPKSFVRSLEFVDAVTEFAKPAVHGIQDMHGTDVFFKFVGKNQKRWPLLAEFCKNFAHTEYLRDHDQRLGTENASMESAQLQRRAPRASRNPR